MSDNSIESIRADVSYMRALAEDGRRTPLLGGAVLVAAGLIYGAASLAHWSIVADIVDVTPAALSVIWGVAVVAFIVALVTIKRRMVGAPGAAAANNQAYGTAWGGLGGATFGIAAALIVAAVKMENTIFIGLFPPAILCVYGGAWLITAGLSGRAWPRYVGFASIALGVFTAWLVGEDVQWLVYALGLLLFATVPGYVMMRDARPAAV